MKTNLTGSPTLLRTSPEALQAAFVVFRRLRPYLGPALWKLIPYEAPGLGTVAVDQWWRLYVDCDAIQKFSVHELATVLYHEVQHLLMGHHARRSQRVPELWNVAVDCEVNTHLQGERDLKLPSTATFPEDFGWPPQRLAEEYYEMIHKMAQPPSTASCGSCAHGQQEPWELGPPSEADEPPSGTSPGEREPLPGVSQEEAEIIKRLVGEEMAAHQRQHGNLPGWAKRFAEAYTPRPTPWYRQLQSRVRGAVAHRSGYADETYSRPDRRQQGGGVILPGMIAAVPEVAIIVDTSGSISPKMLSVAIREVDGVVRSLGGSPVTVLAADTQVHTTQRTRRGRDVQLVGGGGTNMGRAIETALELRPPPQVIVVITDCYTPWPTARPPRTEVVVLRTGKGTPPTWARRVVNVDVS